MTTLTLPSPVREAAFDAVAGVYDETFTNSLVGQAQRNTTWREIGRVFHPGQRILEINCGTGVDAVHLASRGVEVLACDASPRMIQIARARLTKTPPLGRAEFRVLATEDIAALENDGPFDGVLSNFAGLNCIRELSPVAHDLAGLLKPGAVAALCIFGRFSAWEVAWYLLHRKPRKAFRRLRTGPTEARLAAGVTAEVHYYSIRELVHLLAPEFRLIRRKGVGVAVPPSYLEPLARRFPGAIKVLERIDRSLGGWPIWRNLADHVLLTFERTRP